MENDIKFKRLLHLISGYLSILKVYFFDLP